MKIFIPITLLVLVNCSAFAQSTANPTLASIIEKGKQSHSNAVIIIKNNKVLVEEYYGQKTKPEYIASAGKSLTSLAIGKLVDQGKIKSIDQPVYDFFPEWKQGVKKDITIRMLLNHTSGLQNVGNASVELEPAPTYRSLNIIQLALCADVTDKPGTVFSYNNKATALLGGIIEKASGKRMDNYVEENFYRPMDIKAYDWIRDEAGNPTAHGAFILKPMDFAKFGIMLLNNGVYNGQRLISKQWIDESVKAGQTSDLRFGLLWWRLLTVNKRVISEKNLKVLKDAGVNPALVTKLSAMVGDTLSAADFSLALKKNLGDDWLQQINTALAEKHVPLTAYRDLVQSNDALAYYANGYRGNFLVIVPSKSIVAVRVKGNQDDYDFDTDNFEDFVELVCGL